MFIKYQHVERFGTTEVDGIELGKCYVFPKIDGTNGVVWIENDVLQFGSRKRHLTEGFDNHGFKEKFSSRNNIGDFLKDYPDLILYGEYLIPHSLKTYREDAWREFYIFDVCKAVEDELVYLPYNEYQPLLEAFELDYITPLMIVKNATYEKFLELIEKNTFLIKENSGIGEGIVIKNYDYKNKYGRTTWAKIVTNEFRDKHKKEMGAPDVNFKEMIEQEIVNKYVTNPLVEKVYSKIVIEKEGWSSKHIPQLLQRVYYDLIREEAWNFIKEHKNPRINFNTLLKLTIIKVKERKQDLF